MNKVISVIESKGTITQDKNGKELNQPLNYDNYIFNLSSGSKLYTNETLICGDGKPLSIKIKTDLWDKLTQKTDPRMALGKELHVYTELNEIVQITIK